jgi:periplasmic copper chaperone A
MKIPTILAVAAALLTTQPALSQHHDMSHGKMPHALKMAPVAVQSGWARASISKNGAAYAEIVNNGKTADRLIAVKSPAARRVELHTHIMDGNIMRMRRVEGGIAIAPSKSVTMKPGGNHIMLMGLHKKLVAGEQFPITFVLEKAGEIKAMIRIGKLGAMGPNGGPTGGPNRGMQMDQSGAHHGGHKH